MEFIFIEFIAGVASIFSLQELSKRSQLIKTAAYVFLAYTFSYIAIELMTAGSITSFSWKLIRFLYDQCRAHIIRLHTYFPA